MVGFTVKCNKCGKEIILRKDFEKHNDNDKIKIGTWSDECYISIECECGNEIDSI